MRERVLLYLHIPKCGGQTLSKMLRSNFRPADTLHVLALDTDLDDAIRRLDAEALQRVDFIWGHFHFGLHDHLSRPADYITVLRDPVDRIVSLYDYVVREPDHPLHSHARRTGITLEEFVESGIDETQVDNGQTRQLCGRMHESPDRQSLAEAKGHLEACSAVGLTERFDETFVLMRRRLGLRMPFYLRRNVADQAERSAPDVGTVAAIRERSHLDIELYEYATTLFERQLADEGAALKREVARLRRINAVLEPLQSAITPALRAVRRVTSH